MESLDDAGVYQLTDELAIIQTVDFFTPVVDDPYMFGQIAAANSLSDVYTMGGEPITAMNIVCFPIKTMDVAILQDILRGGIDKMVEAGVTLIGGHSIDDSELKYGLSVTGTVHPEKLVTNSGAEAGDRIILTKPLGTGIISTALKNGKVDDQTVARFTECMATLNSTPARLMLAEGVHACTDVTGFGLLGHIRQLAENSKVSLRINPALIPLLPRVEELARQGLCPGGVGRNRDFYSAYVTIDSNVPAHIQDILYDPQTSGGLIIVLAAARAKQLIARLHQEGVGEAVIIGEVIGQPAGTVIVG